MNVAEKRYQVFVSSTYADLREERQHVMQTLMKLDCIPAGMELFPAADEEQWAFIQRVIDDCDYYLLIIGGRYGTTTADGISYTEKEYDYAVERGLKVIALIHEDPGALAVNKSEMDPLLREKLESFREKVKSGRLVSFWSHPQQLRGEVALSVLNAIKTYPAVGWVRADYQSIAAHAEIESLKAANAALRREIDTLARVPPKDVENLAQGDEEVSIPYLASIAFAYRRTSKDRSFAGTLSMSWSTVLTSTAHIFRKGTTAPGFKTALTTVVQRRVANPEPKAFHFSVSLDSEVVNRLLYQLEALALIKYSIEEYQTDGGRPRRGEIYTLTALGSASVARQLGIPRGVTAPFSAITVNP